MITGNGWRKQIGWKLTGVMQPLQGEAIGCDHGGRKGKSWPLGSTARERRGGGPQVGDSRREERRAQTQTGERAGVHGHGERTEGRRKIELTSGGHGQRDKERRALTRGAGLAGRETEARAAGGVASTTGPHRTVRGRVGGELGLRED